MWWKALSRDNPVFEKFGQAIRYQPEDITRLYGTNFDTCVVNQDMLEQMDGEMVSYKAKDKGTKQSLKHNKLLCKGNLVCSNKELNDLFNGRYTIYYTK